MPFSFSPLTRVGLLSCAIPLMLTACAPSFSGAPVRSAPVPAAPVSAQSLQSPLRSRFVTQATVPSAVLQKSLSQAQAYSDLISERRDLDIFKLHPQTVGLQLNDSSYILSWLGTATTRNDLNVELRSLMGQTVGMNLNYSGPVTRAVAQVQNPVSSDSQPLEHSETRLADPAAGALNFELITGLPPEHITNAYGDRLTQLARYLRYRFQSQPVTFDDGPLIYALTTPQEELLGFVFFNQRNLLTLGERKYADVQSVVLIDTQGEVQSAYTIVAFNPKTPQANSPLSYQIETPENLGQLALLGEF